MPQAFATMAIATLATAALAGFYAWQLLAFANACGATN